MFWLIDLNALSFIVCSCTTDHAEKCFPHSFFFFCFIQELGWCQIYSCPRNSSRDDPGHLSVSHWPVTRGGPTAAAVAGPCEERDRVPEGPFGGVGNVGHNVCFLPPKKGGAMLWHWQVEWSDSGRTKHLKTTAAGHLRLINYFRLGLSTFKTFLNGPSDAKLLSRTFRKRKVQVLRDWRNHSLTLVI